MPKKLISNNWQLPSFEKTEMAKKKTKYCLIIPIINEGEKFKKEIRDIKKYTKSVDVIIADGGSTDGSSDIKFLKANGVRTLLVKTSTGKLGTQLRMAFAYALKQGYEGIITMDGNGKDGPEAIPDFIKALESGYDYVQASRFIPGGKAINTPLLRYLGIRFILSPILSIASGKKYTDVTNAFRAYSKNLLLHPKVKPFRDIFVKYEILWYFTAKANKLGLKTKEIPAVRQYPKGGQTPTKITGVKANLDLIKTALRVARGGYDPA